jgi:DNA-directed RNA polymerase subunit RPC12/RpoP
MPLAPKYTRWFVVGTGMFEYAFTCRNCTGTTRQRLVGIPQENEPARCPNCGATYRVTTRRGSGGTVRRIDLEKGGLGAVMRKEVTTP